MYKTDIWVIHECPGYSVERTSTMWILWGPCRHAPGPEEAEECPICGGTGEKIIDTCTFQPGTYVPHDLDMVAKHIDMRRWTPVRVQYAD